MTVPIILLAAGASTRMRGGDKLLEDVDGAPCLQVMAQRAIQTGAPVIVLLPSLDHRRADCLVELNVQKVTVPDASLGMSRSLRQGINALPDTANGVMILPADMPDITTQDMSEMLNVFSTQRPLALRAVTEAGQQGHPIIFDASLFAQFHTLRGDKGAQPILSKLADRLTFQTLKGQRARLDLDTPEAWAAWRALRA